MTLFILKNTDWTKRSSRFYALSAAFAIGASISWVQSLNTLYWNHPFVGTYVVNHSNVMNSLGVMVATFTWGALMSMLLAIGCRREVTRQKVLGFAGLACFIGWDAGWRMMAHTFGWLGPC